MNAALETLCLGSLSLQDAATENPKKLIEILDWCLETVPQNAAEWVHLSCEAKRIPYDAPVAGEEWLAGPVVVVRNLRLLKETLQRIETTGSPVPRSRIHRDDQGHVSEIDVFPTSRFDAMLFPGCAARTRLLQQRSSATGVVELGGFAYRVRHWRSGSSLVLGAGNVSSIPVMDALYKIFVEGNACIVKMNPVNDYLTGILTVALEPLIRSDLLRFVTGGVEEGSYLVHHGLVTDVHITGSDRSHDAIVYGSAERKAKCMPMLAKPITSELGNISPVVIVPGLYTEEELRSMAWNVCTQIVNNGSFNCNAAKVLVLAKGWEQRDAFMDALRACLRATPTRHAYYPGAFARYTELTAYGDSSEIVPSRCSPRLPNGHLPWTIVRTQDHCEANPLFTTEPFCAMVTVTELTAQHAPRFLDLATEFCNERLWGTLNACIMIDPRTEKACADRLDAAVRALRYGTVGINHWPALGYGMVSPPWGGHPSSTLQDIRSGLGWVHNTYMLPDEMIEKTVIRGPLVMRPKPAWFANNRMTHRLGERLVRFEANPSVLQLPGLIGTALRG